MSCRLSAIGRMFPTAGLAVLAVVVAFAVSLSAAIAAPHIVVDVKSGKVLSQEQAFDRWYPASLTKLMTAYTVFREIETGRISMQSPVKVSQNALAEPPSKMGFPVGTVLTVDAAIKILMVKSANDIATALAESTAGSEAAFIARMNENARRLGMNDTNFTNAHGLHDTRQYTTARDLAVLALAIRREFGKYDDYFNIPAIKVGKRKLSNHNPLLSRFDGTNGMKTGFLCASGLNIAVSARRGFRELVAVVLGGPTGQERNVRAAKLLSDGFSKNVLFVSAKLDDLRPSGAVNRTPRDIRDFVCSRKKKPVTTISSDTVAVFALKEPTLDDLEEKYLKPQSPITRIVPVVLGNATGPDPFGLVGGSASSSSASAYSSEDNGTTAWPIVHGTKNVRVPLPEPRPRR